MGKIKTSISIEENVSSAFKSMNTVVNSTLNTFRNLNNTINETPNISNKNESILNSINDVSNNVANSINNMNRAIDSSGEIKEENVNKIEAMGIATGETASKISNLSNELIKVPTINNENINKMEAMNNATNDVISKTQQLSNEYSNVKISNDNVSSLNSMAQETNNVSNSIQQLNSNISSIPNTDYWTEAVGHYSKSALEAVYTTEELVQMGFKTADALNQPVSSVDNLNNGVSELKANLANWQAGSNIELFDSSGIARYKQEINDVNQMSNRLLQSQLQIQNQANKTNILPVNAITDINNLNNRIVNLRNKIQEIEDNKITSIGAEKVNSQIEELREKLNNAIQSQESLNDALNNMDSSGANKAYIELENNIRNTEKYIRDNTDQQGKFNSSIKEGNSLANGLGSTIKRVVGAYLGIQGARKAFSFIQDSTDAANVQIQAETKLNTITNKRMHASQQQVQALKQQASALQQVGVIGDEVTISGQATLATFLNSTKSVESLTGAMDNLLAYTNGVEASAENAVSTANQIGKAMANNSLASLTRSGITVTDAEEKQFKALTSEEEKAALLAKIITNNVGEMNTALANTPVGQQQQLANAWGDMKENVGNKVYPAIMKMFSSINANMPIIQNFVDGFANGMYYIIGIITNLIDLVCSFAGFVSDNWSIIEPIILGIAGALAVYYGAQFAANTISAVTTGIHMAMAAAQMIHAAATGTLTAATAAEIAAQNGLNAALYACPLVWILILIIAVVAAIYAVIAVINKVTGSSISATGVIVGVLTSAVAFIWNLFLGLLDLVLGVINAMVNPWISFANFFGNIFNDPIASIVHLFGDMADRILGILESIAKAIDKVFGSNLSSAVSGWRGSLNSKVEAVANKYGNGSYEKVAEELNLSSESLGLSRWSYGDAWNSGYSWGEGIEKSVGSLFSMDSLDLDSITGLNNLSNSDTANLANNAADTANNTGKIADSMDITEEDLKYLRDIAEQEVINRFTTAEINVEMNNNNNINNEADLDGIVSNLEDKIYEMAMSMAEGVHS